MTQSLIRTRIANLLLNFAISIETSCYVSILSEYSKVLIFNLKTLKQIAVKQIAVKQSVRCINQYFDSKQQKKKMSTNFGERFH